MGLQRVERRLERAIEGAFARAFKSEIRPVEIGRRLVRHMDLDVTVGVRGEVVAPNAFEVHISPEDLERFGELAQVLPAELAGALEEHAADERYVLKGPLAVQLVPTNRYSGTFEVLAAIKPGVRRTAPQAWLVQADGTKTAVRADDPVTIGRLPECDIVTADPNVSRRHAEIRVVDGRVRVVDLGSLNGTQVNGRGVPTGNDGAEAVAGDRINVGALALRLEIGDANVAWETVDGPRKGK
jgi:Protein of unknown function (DUF3662)/FHA domain